MLDHRNDIFITLFTILAIMLTKINVFFVDGLVGIGISIWIFITAIKLFKESYDVLMDISLDNENKRKIMNVIESHDEIKRVGSFYSIPIGYKYIVVITIYVNGNLKTKKSHDIADKIEKEIKENVDIIEHIIVHIEPYN